jgi:hypothetical protein
MPEADEVVVILEERAFEPLVKRPDALDDVARSDPERAVEATGLDSGFFEHERARDHSRDAEVVDVALDDPGVVGDDGDVVAACKPEADVHVPRKAGALVDDDELLAVIGKRAEACAERLVDFGVDGPVRDDDAEPHWARLWWMPVRNAPGGCGAADLEDVSRALALLLALTAWACSAWALLVGVVWGLGLKCDDSCSAREGWRGDPDAWQWNGLAALGVLAFVAGAAFFVFVWRRRPWSAAAAMVVGFGSVFVMVDPLTSEWIEHLDRRSPGELLMMTASVFAPVFAVLLTMPEVVRRREG